MSARALTAAIGLPASSIYYHFGDLEQLLEQSQARAREACERWSESQLAAIGAGPDGPAAFGRLMATIIDDWCEMQRRLAFAWRECQLMALRDPRHIGSCAQWDALWQRFWETVCARLGLAGMGTPAAWFFAGTAALHLMRWRRPVDRAALGELCTGWAEWLDGRLAGPSPWFALARADAAALILPPPPYDPVVESIAEAAARTVARLGVARLTHRAVATEADVTVGLVSYKFRTSADLLSGAFEAIYRRMVPAAADDVAAVATLHREEALARLDAGPPERADLLGADELQAAAARSPAFQAFAAQLRYLRGRSSGPLFQALMGDSRPIAPIDAAIFSALMAGRVRATLCGGRPWDDGGGTLKALLARLDPPG